MLSCADETLNWCNDDFGKGFIMGRQSWGPRDRRSALGAVARLAASRATPFHSHPNLKEEISFKVYIIHHKMLIIITFIFPPFLAAAAPPREGGNESLLPGFFGIGCVMSKCHSKIEMVDVETRNPLRRMIKTSEMSCIKLHCLFDCWFVCLLQCV